MESLPFTIQRRLLPAFAAVLSSMLGSNRLMMYALAMYWCIGMKNFLVEQLMCFTLYVLCARLTALVLLGGGSNPAVTPYID